MVTDTEIESRGTEKLEKGKKQTLKMVTIM
jgi:hypothetical protein